MAAVGRVLTLQSSARVCRAHAQQYRHDYSPSFSRSPLEPAQVSAKILLSLTSTWVPVTANSPPSGEAVLEGTGHCHELGSAQMSPWASCQGL